MQVSQMTAFQGPLPPPESIEHYDRILPGSADRIMAQWERQTAHRQDLERRTITANLAAQTRGQYFAFVLGLVILAIAAGLFYQGNDGWAFATILGGMGTILSAFIYGRAKQQQERDAKAKAS